jgi:hypothetical protein
MDHRTTICSLEPVNPAKPSFTRKHPILHGVWVGGSATSRSDLWSITESELVKQQEKNTRYEIRKTINSKKGNCRLTNQGLRPSDLLSALEAVEGSTASKMKLGQGQGRHKISVGQIQNRRHSAISKISKRTCLPT